MFKRKGGVKGLLNDVKKNCTFLKGWLPLGGLIKTSHSTCFVSNNTLHPAKATAVVVNHLLHLNSVPNLSQTFFLSQTLIFDKIILPETNLHPHIHGYR